MSVRRSLLHVFLGRVLFPCRFHVRVCLVIVDASFRSVWPIHPRCLLLISSPAFCWCVFSHKSLLLMVFGQRILSCIYVCIYLSPFVNRFTFLLLHLLTAVGQQQCQVISKVDVFKLPFYSQLDSISSLPCACLHNLIDDQKEEDWGQRAILSNSSLRFKTIGYLSTMYYSAACSFVAVLRQADQFGWYAIMS